MLSPSHGYWLACGSPPVPDTRDLPPGARCALCAGLAARGLAMVKWSGAESLILDKLTLPSSPWVCAPCLWATAWNAPPGRAAKEGQSRGPAPPMYSHHAVLSDDATALVSYANASKGEKPAILGWLRADKPGPWWCVVADMGKKHLIPWAPLNPPGRDGVVLLDEQEVTLGDFALVDAMVHVLTVGATKATVETGAYTPNEWTRCPADLQAFEARWGGLRGSAWFSLGLWLAQRDEAAVEQRMADEKVAREARKEAARKPRSKAPPTPKTRPGKADKAAVADPSPASGKVQNDDRRQAERTPADPHGGGAARPEDPGPAQRLEPAGPVGPAGQPGEGIGQRQRQPRGVVQRHAAPAPTERTEQGQLGLFD